MNKKKAIVIVVAVFLAFFLIMLVVQIAKGTPPAKELVLGAIELHETDDKVRQAELISEMDGMVGKLDSPQTRTQWISLTGCIAENTCTNDDFFNLVIAAAIEYPEEVPHSRLIVDLVTVNRYWGSEKNLVDFSKALADANRQIDELDIQVASNKWETILKCEGTCPEFHNLFYEMIRLVVQV